MLLTLYYEYSSSLSLNEPIMTEKENRDGRYIFFAISEFMDPNSDRKVKQFPCISFNIWLPWKPEKYQECKGLISLLVFARHSKGIYCIVIHTTHDI